MPDCAYLPEAWSPDERRILLSALVKQSEGCTPMVTDLGGDQLSDLPTKSGRLVFREV
jgi:hypothetical protein